MYAADGSIIAASSKGEFILFESSTNYIRIGRNNRRWDVRVFDVTIMEADLPPAPPPSADRLLFESRRAAAIMAKALNPIYGGRREKSPRSEPPRSSAPSPNFASSEPCVQLCVDSLHIFLDDRLVWPEP